MQSAEGYETPFCTIVIRDRISAASACDIDLNDHEVGHVVHRPGFDMIVDKNRPVRILKIGRERRKSERREQTVLDWP